ncbi:MAG TPA: DUF4178 domain-containing protein [Ottowia sp.]|nr:DUF4178 domain-containing protein [Ottowia sp.]
MSDAGATQRHYRADCPSCGAPVDFLSAQSTHAVCAYCKSTVVREGDVLKRIGKMAELIDDHGLLQLGASGQADGQGFTLVGRLQYGYPEGTWSEWHALLSDGSSAWLSEDNGAYVFSRPVQGQLEVPAADRFSVGNSTTVGGQRYTVTSSQRVALLSAEGELPRMPDLGAEFSVVELRSQGGDVAAARVLSIDYGSQPPELSLGRSVELADLNMRGLKGESAAQGRGRQLTCPNCGSPVEVKLESSQSITCPQCNALIDLSQGVAGELKHALQDEPVRPAIALGKMGQLDGIHWQVVGFQHRMGQSPGDDESFGWSEYLLYNAKKGFAFLVDSEEGWSFVRPTTGAPEMAAGGQSARYGGATYRLQWAYRAETTYALGEFYWRVQRGQVTQNRDFAAGDRLLSLEQSPNELTWSAGSKLAYAAVAKAFGLSPSGGSAMRADAGPFTPARSVSVVTIIIVLLVVLLLLWLISSSSGGSGVRTGGGSFGGFSTGGGHK